MMRATPMVLLLAGLLAGCPAPEQPPPEEPAVKEAAEPAAPVAHHADELQWEDRPDGTSVAVLYGDPQGPGHFVIRVRFPAGHEIPRHVHPRAEYATVLSGTLELAMGTGATREDATVYGPGDFLVLPGETEAVGWVIEEAVVQAHGQGPFETIPVEEAGSSP